MQNLLAGSRNTRPLLQSVVGLGHLNRNPRVAQAHKLPDLPYDFNALEPTISAEIMRLHYNKHHATYVSNLNIAEEQLAEAMAKNDITKAISLQPAVRFNGGGHINHSIFWHNLSPKGGGTPKGSLSNAIAADFGSFEEFKSKLSALTIGIHGSGWGWLGLNPITKRLQLATCANQDPLEGTTGLKPLLGIDVWEHAYYLQYKNVRADYVKAIWNIINWDDVAARFDSARS
ncbi:Superoxide dismutase [Mn], mitochondrial [Clonorchis sinensis]|uniref:Superoxide dismutase n=1 Tax=Clonorchis sinensis TaxID=79923 RepID=Q6Q2Z4_CLOSI|nr:manganese superoxide dismutase [Clonorchis sinensis]KAG5442560.1 Superoxide dismutase [Mn], mitochondrial [Clonorchis sinensis]